MLGFGLAELGLENEGVADRDGLSGKQAGNDLDGTVVLAAGGDLADLEAALVAHEHHALAVDGLQRGLWEPAPPPRRCESGISAVTKLPGRNA